MFDQAPDLYDLFYSWKDYRGEAEKLRDIVRRSRPDAESLLDVACGTGAHLEHLRDWFRVEGLDADPSLLAVAPNRLPDVPLHEAEMRHFELGRQVDAITCLFKWVATDESAIFVTSALRVAAPPILHRPSSPDNHAPRHGLNLTVARAALEDGSPVALLELPGVVRGAIFEPCGTMIGRVIRSLRA